MITATVDDVLERKGRKVVSIDADEPVHDGLELMVRHNVGAVLVMRGGKICGIFTERDYLRKVALTNLSSREAKVVDVATCKLVAIDPTYSVVEAMAMVTEQRCRHLPVMKGDELVGIVSIGDLVRQASTDQETHIHYLTDYLTGKYPG